MLLCSIDARQLRPYNARRISGGANTPESEPVEDILVLHKLPLKIIVRQLLITGLVAVILAFWIGPEYAKAAVAGGSIAAFLTFFVGVRAFATPKGAVAGAMYNALLRAQILKFFIAALLFGLAALYFAEQYMVVIATYLAATMVYLTALRWSN